MGFRAPASSTRLSGAAPGSGGELGNPLAMSAAGRGQGGRDPPVSKVPSLPDAPTPRAANRKPLPPLQALPSVSGWRGPAPLPPRDPPFLAPTACCCLCPQIMQLLTRGNRQRTQEPTAANQTSSRSHAVLQVAVRQQRRGSAAAEEVRVGRLFMVDLAGSERASQVPCPRAPRPSLPCHHH